VVVVVVVAAAAAEAANHLHYFLNNLIKLLQYSLILNSPFILLILSPAFHTIYHSFSNEGFAS
jgi:hypothetical protein